MPRERLPYVLLPVAALIAILPLILRGPSCGHDFTFHILNWFEAAAQFRHGNLHPQWAFSPAWNAGEPRFVFYPPLSWTIGAILGLLMPWTWTPIAYTWLALTASGLAMHRLARAHASPHASLLAATLYLANPYMLFTAYERTAYAELFAAAFLPLLFHAILKPRPTIPALAIPLALLWLTNAPAAVMATYTLALLATIRLVTAMKLSSFRGARGSAFRLATTTAAGTLLGLSLAAFYIVPAATQRPLVQIAMVILPGLRIDDNTLFHHTGITPDALAHDAVLRTASLLALLLLTATFALLLLTAVSQKHRKTSPIPPLSKVDCHRKIDCHPSNVDCHPSASREDLLFPPAPIPLPLALLTLTIAFLLTPVSLPIWHHAPQLAFLQFPWRLLAILATILALAAALALRRLTWQPLPTVLATLTLATLLTYAATPVFRQPCDPEDTIPTRLTDFLTHQGTEPTDEYTPTPADNDSLHPHNPPFWLSPNPDAPPPTNATPGPAPEDLTLTSPIPQQIILNLRQYPVWHITLNDRELPSTNQTPRADGLLNLPIPAGLDHLQITYKRAPLEQAAEALSILAALVLLVLLFPARRNLPGVPPSAVSPKVGRSATAPS